MINTKVNLPCFFMICNNTTEEECLQKGLFGDRKWRLPHLKSIKRGDIGFLLNITKDELLGIFVAESEAQISIDPNAWNGKFPSQVKVKLIGELQRIPNASKELERIVRLKEVKKKIKNGTIKITYMVPAENTYGPDITNRVLSLFKLPEELEKYFKAASQEVEIGVFSEYRLDDVAGLDEVKDFIYQRIIAPFEDEEIAYRLGLRIGGGVLLFGPPGTGKTLIAMAIANHIHAKFIEISPSIIIGYPGEAEKKIENIFSSLEKEPRAVVFLDEAEWILCRREEQTSSVMQRVTPVLLVQLGRIFKQKKKPIVIIAATNRPEMIDPAFLRPGRFDKIFYVPLPDKKAREKIIEIHLQNRENELKKDDIAEIADKLEGYSGADIAHIVEEAAYNAFKRRKTQNAKITKEDIIKVIEQTTRSITAQEVERIEKWATGYRIPKIK